MKSLIQNHWKEMAVKANVRWNRVPLEDFKKTGGDLKQIKKLLKKHYKMDDELAKFETEDFSVKASQFLH